MHQNIYLTISSVTESSPNIDLTHNERKKHSGEQGLFMTTPLLTPTTLKPDPRLCFENGKPKVADGELFIEMPVTRIQ